MHLRCAVAAGAALTVGALFALPQQSSSAQGAVLPSAASPLAGLLHPHPGPGPVSSSSTSSTSSDPTSDGTLWDGGSLEDGTDSSGDLGLQFVVDTAAASSLAGGGIPEVALAAYRQAAGAAPSSCGIDWSLLAAIGRVESDHGRFAGAVLHTDGVSTPRILGPVLDGTGTALVPDTDGGRLDGNARYDRAVGPMQFIPSTWTRYAADGNGDGRKDPFNVYDAARAAASYLCAAGGHLSTPQGRARAVLAYNHSDSYVATVLAMAAFYAGTGPAIPDIPDMSFPEPAIEPVNPAPPPALGEVRMPDTPPTSDVQPAQTSPTTPPVAPTPSPDPTPTPTPTPTPDPTPTPTPTPSPDPTPTPTPTPDPTPTPTPGGACPVVPTGLVLDVVDDTGQAGVADRVRSDLQAGRVTVGTVTSGPAGAPSAIEYPAAQQSQAQQFADAIGAASYLQAGQVSRITVVLGSGDEALLTALDRLIACATTTSSTAN